MAYIGPEPNPGQNREVDDISSGFNGGTAAFTLQVNGQNVSPGSSNNIIVSLGGVIQNPGTDYNIAGSTITFTTNPASGLSFFGLVLGQQVDIQSLADGTSPTMSAPTITGDLSIADKIVHTGDTNNAIRFPAADTIAAETAGAERLRVDSSGNLLLGHSSARPIAGSTNRKFQIEATDASASLSITRVGANSAGGFLSFGKSRSASIGGNTIVNDGDVLGTISFAGADGTNLESRGADIQAAVDGTPGVDDMPGRLIFKTSPDGSVSTTERMRIDSSGNTHFGSGGSLNSSDTVSIIPADGRISFGMDGRDSLVTGESGAYIFSGSGASGDIPAGQLVIQSRSNVNRDIKFASGATPKVRARFRGSDGDFFFGEDLGSITNIGTAFRENDAGTNHSSYIEIGHGTTGAAYSYIIFRFGGSGTTIGSIAQNNGGTGVSFNTSSDYRLKTNEALITDGITRIKQLKPYQFEWKSDLGTKVDGFFAHEVSSIVPEAITGEKDAVETTYYEEEKNLPEGKSVGDVKETDRPVYQTIDQSKLVPLLTAALQEEISKREALETRVAALEAA